VVSGTAGAYLLTAAATLLLSGPAGESQGIVCPVYPAAGLALAATLAFGWTAVAGVVLGSALLFALAAAFGLLPAGFPVAAWLAISAGAGLQGWFGSALLHRFVAAPLSLNTPRAVLTAGLLGGLLASLVNPTVAAMVLRHGSTEPGALWGMWWSWWLADATGVLLFAPVVLSFIGKPAVDWRPRRRWVAVPLLLALALLVASTLAFERLQARHAMATFERDASRLAHAVEARLVAPVLALRALHGAVLAHGGTEAPGFEQATRWWLAQPYEWLAMGLARRVSLPELPLLEHAAAGSASAAAAAAKPFDRDGGAARAADQEVLVVSQVQPLPANQELLGLNLWSMPASRAAALAARASGQPAASAAFTWPDGGRQENAVVLYLALYDGQPGSEADRVRQFSGAVLLTLSAERALKGMQEAELSQLDWCLLDADESFASRRLAGPPGCERLPRQAASTLQLSRRLMLADRPVSLHVSRPADRLSAAPSRSRWLVPGLGLAASALLGALLLIMTGQSRRTEQAVLDRTIDLRREMAERAQAQEALKASEERLRAVVDNLPLGIALVDSDGLMLECNPRLCGMLGRSTEHLRGASVLSCFEADEEIRIRELRTRLIGHRGPVDSVESLKLRAANGRLTEVRVVASALYDAAGRMAFMVAVVEDMTAHHQLLESELALGRAQAGSRAKSEFVSRMSHELRTPLNAMIGFAQLLTLNNHPPLAPHQLEWTQQIQRAGWHLLAMINDTLDLARIESGATRLSLESLQLRPLLNACRDWVHQAAAQRAIQLHMAVQPDVSAALADSTRLKQVLTNLLSNAVKYNREGGSVDIQARNGIAGEVEISVTDTGLGMTSEQLAALFQPYNRLGRERSAIEGTGIGLVISRRLAELMGGTLQVRSEPGKGSVFTLRLPATDDPASDAAASEEPGPTRYQQRLVHYVEDNPTNVEVMRGVLMQRSQITMQTSVLGLDGLSAIRHSRPDLILLDMQLPDISGLELLRHIKLDDQIASIPVIVVSADATPQNMERALTLGAKHYVTKPLEIAAFLALVDEALAGTGSMT
jgi:PAS domain S-box-containing protein